MAINFFDPACATSTNEKIFGIIDVPPATLHFTNDNDWGVRINNEQSLQINFTAIDACLGIPRHEGERCEGMLTYSNAIMFVELKDRAGGRWAGKARDQLENTIKLFARDVGLAEYARKYAHIANKQRPNFKSGGSAFSQELEDRTGFILRVSNVIEID